MWKNVVIGILLVFSLFFFFFGLTQQLKAENYKKLLKKMESEALQQKEMQEEAMKQAQQQIELLQQGLEGVRK